MIRRAITNSALLVSTVAFLCIAAATPAMAANPTTINNANNCCSLTVNADGSINTKSTTSPAAAASTNASGTVTLGGTYQTVFASNTSRKGCLIQNPTTATEVLNVRVGGAAVFTLSAGSTFSCSTGAGGVVSDLIEVTAATTTHAFTAVSQ